MTTIHTLKPNVSREDAITHFSGPLTSLRFGRVHTVADIYIPFRLFRVHITNRSRTEARFLGLDAVEGSFDLYSFDSVPDRGSLITLDTRNCPPRGLDPDQAGVTVVERVRRLVFSRGFFKIRNLDIAAELVPLDFHVPYWVGFSGSPSHLRLTVMDAIRRRFEGAKVRNFVRDWLSDTALSEQV
ncbi:MAG: hypothetical protein LAO21_07975 [Acidobacteriia bacterium]|nr:hypothetical protein [Terriglobia bacterium]